MDQTYVKVAGQWKSLYRAVDGNGSTVDFLLRAKQDHDAARAFFERAIGLHGVPEEITIDKSGANTAAIMSMRVIRKGQLGQVKDQVSSAPNPFYCLAF